MYLYSSVHILLYGQSICERNGRRSHDVDIIHIAEYQLRIAIHRYI
jgi:hypothetical protein